MRGEFDPRVRGPPLGLGLLRENVEARAVDRASEALEVMGLSPQMTSLKKVMLTNDAKCNDGSPAGFYYRLAPNSRRWIVFLEGGWYCFNARSCKSRWKTSGHLMTSLGWAEHRNVGGVLSSDPAENPHWWRSNHVYIPYCSSDCWSGTRKGSANLTFNQVYSMFNNNYWYSQTNSSHKDNDVTHFEVTNLPFMGALILEEVVKQLVSLGLAAGHSLILAGSSAGGIGVLLNLDNVQQQLMKLRVDADVQGIADSAWFLDNKPFAPMDCHDAHTCPPTQAMKLGHGLWKARLPSMCGRSSKERPWECFLGYKVLPTIQRSLFIFQWVFDEAQMLLDNVGKPVSKQQWNYIHSIGERIKHSLNNISVVFAPSCISHTTLTTRLWSAIKIGDVSLSDALHCWAKLNAKRMSTKLVKRREKINSSRETFLPLADDIANVSEDHLTPSSAKKIPREKKKSSKRIRHVKSKRSKCRKCKRRRRGKHHQQKVSETADRPSAGGTSSGNNGSRHFLKYSSNDDKRSDWFEPRTKPTDRLDLSVIKMLADSPGGFADQEPANLESGTRSRQEKTSDDSSLNTKRKEKKRKNKQRKKERRRRKRKQRKKEKRKERRREGRNKKRKITKRKKDFPFSLIEKNRNPRSSSPLDRSGVGEEQLEYLTPIEATTEVYVLPHEGPDQEQGKSKELSCPLHLVDKCSWPHCNPTCPPLINPYTGEEMNRVQLLKSFGLSMVDLAHALGIDMATLKAMDNKDIFLILSP